MNWLTRVMVALLGRAAGLLPADRREWARALWTEADEVPAGWPRLTWLAGGARWTMQEAALGRMLGYPLAFAAAAAGLAWSAWSGPPGDSAIAINRVDVISIAVILAVLPWLIRRARGPIAGGRLARLVRTGGYATVLALVLVKAAVERVADAPPNNLEGSTRAWIGEVVFLAVMVGYAGVILACTARRSPAVPGTVAIGTATGAAIGVMVYALGPLGFPLRFTGTWPARLYDAAMALGVLLTLCALILAGLATALRSGGSKPAGSRVRQGAMAGLCTGTAAALVVTALSTATIALLPYNTGLRTWAAGHIGQWTPVVGQVTPVIGVRLGYVAGASAFAAGYLIVLLLGPLFGCGIGAWAGLAAGNPRPSRPRLHRGDPPAPASPAQSLPSSRQARSKARAPLTSTREDRVNSRHLRYGRPLLTASARFWAGTLLASCVILVAVLGMIFAHQTTADRLDHAIDSPVIAWLGGHPGLAAWLAAPGSQLPAVALSAVIVVICLLTGRLNGAILAAVAVPAAVGLNDGLVKPLVHRTYLGVLSYPSGHTATMFALAATVAALLLIPPQSATARPLRILIPVAACALGVVVAIGVIGLRWHYFTDTLAGAAVGIGTVCGLALLLDLSIVRRWLARGSHQPSAQERRRAAAQAGTRTST
jgi:membrane-associated phospholipid phosphatase